MDQVTSERVKARFLKELKHHLDGWRAKVKNDFGEVNYNKELAELTSDSLYPRFNFATAEYVNIRFIGRMSISIGRRLGEIYDKIPRFLVGARFNLEPKVVAPKIEKLELDICLEFERLEDANRSSVYAELAKIFPDTDFGEYLGLGIEIRYNFNPNDSSRLRKDVDMAKNLIKSKLFPIYLIFSSISPRDEAIKRLTAAEWNFVVGKAASSFSANLFGLDLSTILDLPEVKDLIHTEIDAMMSDLKMSHSFGKFIANEYIAREVQASIGSPV